MHGRVSATRAETGFGGDDRLKRRRDSNPRPPARQGGAVRRRAAPLDRSARGEGLLPFFPTRKVIAVGPVRLTALQLLTSAESPAGSPFKRQLSVAGRDGRLLPLQALTV